MNERTERTEAKTVLTENAVIELDQNSIQDARAASHLAAHLAHYRKANAKHPALCDRIIPRGLTLEKAEFWLAHYRREVAMSVEKSESLFINLVLCEYHEMIVELLKGNTFAAVDEAYDCVALFDRLVDAIRSKSIPLTDKEAE
jgi:hypothetical protein